MRKYLLAAVAATAIASPAIAADNSGYFGVEGGVLFPQDIDVDGAVDFVDPLVTDLASSRVAQIDYKRGYDVDAIAGYDFGMFRLEAELGYKRAKADNLEVDQDVLDAISDEIGSEVTNDDLDLRGKTTVLSIMGNALLDFGDPNGFGAYVGGGFGRARVKAFGDRDTAWAWQAIAGVRTAVSDNVDVGLKYRYFRTARLNFNDQFAFDGGTALLSTNDRFSSHSALLSLIFNFAGAAPPPPPPVAETPPPPPPPPAPETQTCPDGSVILVTDMCPAPPPPPPPPAPEPQRG